MSAFEEINGIKQIDPQSLIELSLSFAIEENMTNRQAAEHICSELRSFMDDNNIVITPSNSHMDAFPSNLISFMTNTLPAGDSHTGLNGCVMKEIEPYIKPLVDKLTGMGCPPELAAKSANRILDNIIVVEGFGRSRYRFHEMPKSNKD
jgi:hypothetical protein